MPMTLDAFERLVAALPDGPLTFAFDDAPARGGLHVTELRRHDVRAVDCAAQTAEWTETVIQVLDGAGGAPMPARTLKGILAKAIDGAGAERDAPVRVEFGPDRGALALYHPVTAEGATLRFASDRAACRPLQQGSCC